MRTIFFGFINAGMARIRGIFFKFDILLTFLFYRRRISFSTIVRMDKDVQIIIGKGSRIVELGKIVLKRGATLFIGDNTSIDRVCEIIIEENGVLKIGNNCFIGSHSNIRVTGETYIGNDCRIAQFVSLINGSYGFKERDKLIREQPYVDGFVRVGDDVWLGLSVVVLPNTIIGKGAVIGAGTIISKNVPDYSIVVGNPQRIIGTRQ